MIEPPLDMKVDNAPVLSSELKADDPAARPLSPAPCPHQLYQHQERHAAAYSIDSWTAGAAKLPRELRNLQDILASGRKYHAPSTVPHAHAWSPLTATAPRLDRDRPADVRDALARPEADE